MVEGADPIGFLARRVRPNKIRNTRKNSSMTFKGERVLHMPYTNGIVAHQHTNHIETVGLTTPAMSVNPRVSRPR